MDTLTTSEVSPLQQVEELSPEQIDETLDGILAVTNEQEAGQQQLGYEEIAKMFLDAHNDQKEALQQEKRELIVGKFLDNPVEAFRGEFLELKLLFENRTSSLPRYDDTVLHEFCTQNHQRKTCDYLFRHTERPDGSEKFEVTKVFNVSGKPDTISVSLEEGDLHVIAQQRDHGRTVYVELEEDKKERVLAQLFYDTIHASAEQIEREYDERVENDQRAKQYLKGVRDNEYVQF